MTSVVSLFINCVVGVRRDLVCSIVFWSFLSFLSFFLPFLSCDGGAPAGLRFLRADLGTLGEARFCDEAGLERRAAIRADDLVPVGMALIDLLL